MSKTEKNFLLVLAICFGVLFSFAVAMFGAAVGGKFNYKSFLFFILMAVVISSPVWLAVIIPSRFKLLSMIFRWIGATALILPAYFFIFLETLLKRLFFPKIR